MDKRRVVVDVGGTVSNVLGIILFVVGVGFAYRWTKSKVTKS